jgi:hypothetical protein
MGRLVWLSAVWLAVGMGVAAAAPVAAPRVLTAEQWREDLRTLARELPRVHRNAFFELTPARFDSAVAALDRDIPSRSDHDIVLDLTRIVAMVHDGHTRLAWPEDPSVAFDLSHSKPPPPKWPALLFHRYPLRLYLYRDGLFVQGATPELRRAVGARVVRIGDVPAEAALERMRPLIPCDNEWGFKLWAPTRLVIPEVLKWAGLSDDPGHATFALRDTAGREFSVALTPLPVPAPRTWLDVRDAAAPQRALWQRDPDNAFWMEYLEPEQLLYVQINRIADKPDETLAQFARRIGDVLERRSVDKIALDLRQNSGGDGMLNRGLVLALARAERVDRPGRLFVIFGRGTFSAAIMLASALEYWTNVVFVGEPTGSTPNAYGDPKKFTLPNSGLIVRASSIYWRDWTTDEHRPWIAPDLSAELSSADDRAHRDPALEAVLRFPASDDLGTTLHELAKRGYDPAQMAYWRHVTDPRTALDPQNAALADTLKRLEAAAGPAPH